MTRGSYAVSEDETLVREQNFCSSIHNGVIPHPTDAQARSCSDYVSRWATSHPPDVSETRSRYGKRARHGMNSAQAFVSAGESFGIKSFGITSCGVAVMEKAPARGRTKPRFVPPLTGQEAAAFNTAFLQDISANILAARKVRRIQPYMAYGPPGPD